jgi:hypothetical protein
MNTCIRFALTVILVTVSCLGAEPAKNTRVALVIGNSRYEAAIGPLRNTVNDAKAMSKTLRGIGFNVIEKQNVTRDELFAAVMQFRAKLRGAEIGLFYFAGHGISVAGANYLIPLKSRYDPADTDDTTLRLLAETKLFNVEQAVAEMTAAGAPCNLVILDACRNTPIARNPRTRDAASAGGLSEMKPPAGSLIAFATDAGRVANDGDGTNGLYTEELLKNLRTPGLSIEQVFKRTRAAVLTRSGGTQIPAEYSRLIGDDIFLAGASVAETPATPSPAAIAAPTLAEIKKAASSGDAERCIELLKLRGPGSGTADALETLLDHAKESLRDASAQTPASEAALKSCELILDSLDALLPANSASRMVLAAKAQNRRGDALLLHGRESDALEALNSAAALAPTDGYVLYNRGRAHLALGHKEEARADFTAASNPKLKQPGARRLALATLAKME